MKKRSSKINGLKGGRPKFNPKIKINIPNIDLVILTPSQYDTLLEKYGYCLLRKALSILECWLRSENGSKYQGKNNYAHFRSDGWVVNTAKYFVEKVEKNKF